MTQNATHSEINPGIYNTLDFHKHAWNTPQRKDCLFSKFIVLRKPDIVMQKGGNEPQSHTLDKSNSKQTKHLNVRPTLNNCFNLEERPTILIWAMMF